MLGPAAAAVRILNDALGIVKAARERAQSSRDPDLKDLTLTLYDHVLSLKEAVMLVTDENNELRRKIAELEHPAAKPELRQVGVANFYFVGDVGPYCQACYDGSERLTRLSPPESWNGGIRRKCVICKQYFYEKRDDDDEPAFAIG